jgi:hypothetical protein
MIAAGNGIVNGWASGRGNGDRASGLPGGKKWMMEADSARKTAGILAATENRGSYITDQALNGAGGLKWEERYAS